MFWLLSVTMLRDCQYFYTELLQLTVCVIVSCNNTIIKKPKYIPLNYTEWHQVM